jgi:tRNA-splicing ligase RtcB
VGPPKELRRIDDFLWELPPGYVDRMRVPARFYASEPLIRAMDDAVFRQAAQVATLPGIVGYSFCMPDGHYGYGFPIGGVAAFDPAEGVISPGGIGFDINCGMRLVKTDLTLGEVKPLLKKLVDRLFERIPSGVGTTGHHRLTAEEFHELAETGARWCLRRGYATEDDLAMTEEGGCMGGADATRVSERAVERGRNQVGTLGSGNHYLEVQVATEANVIDGDTARVFGITMPDQVVVMFHCGSRGFGHQIASDYMKRFLEGGSFDRGPRPPDRELACAPYRSELGQSYYAAMACAVNMAYANRQLILHAVREVFSDVFHRDPADLGMEQVYDVAHNTAKMETHRVGGNRVDLLVHRKGATRAFGPGMKDIPERYRETGQPVIIGGSMESGSYLLAGVVEGSQTFFTTAHGSGRTMSRRAAKRAFDGRKLQRDMEARGIYVRTGSYGGLAEESGRAYKDIDEVVRSTGEAGISRPVVRFLPIGNVKG